MPNVLSIGCDPESLEGRHLILREAGVVVTSVLGYTELKNIRPPVYSDVVLIGDEWPICEVERLVSWAHNNAPRAMVVVLQKNGTAQTCEKCYYADADDPRDWLPPVKIPPTEFTDQMEDLENWANTNNKEAMADLMQYWALKLPAIFVSVSSAVFVHFKLNNLAVVAGAVAAACVLIDGLNPRGALRNVHRRAYNEISTLHANMAAKWRTDSLRREEAEQLAAEIIAESEAERNRISAYLTAAETALSDRRVDVEPKP
jgi:hypothetical protein